MYSNETFLQFYRETSALFEIIIRIVFGFVLCSQYLFLYATAICWFFCKNIRRSESSPFKKDRCFDFSLLQNRKTSENSFIS